MENKKLLKYLLKDLSELEEMFNENGKNCFDELEMEFIQNRVTGAKKLVKMFFENEPVTLAETKPVLAPEQKNGSSMPKEEKKSPEITEKMPGNRWQESETTFKPELKENVVIQNEDVVEKKPVDNTAGVKIEEIQAKVTVENVIIEEKNEEQPETKNAPPVSVDETITSVEQKVRKSISAVQQELQLEDDEPVDIHHKRLGDIFIKEKSVNESVGEDLSKLEHKLSNMPVTSIQSAIGINDRFQYIRELFDGSAEHFLKTVNDLDSMGSLKEAVNYLQENFRWKKNETSLKFVNLVKRRFPQ